MVLKFNLKRFLISLAIPIIAGAVSALIIKDDMNIYSTINRPPLSPPSWLFPVVWTILYALMGISLYLVWNSDASGVDKRRAFIPVSYTHLTLPTMAVV